MLNKVDYLTDTEQGAGAGFCMAPLMIFEPVLIPLRIFTVSARKGLQAKESDDTLQWEESGLAEVFDHLIAFLAGKKTGCCGTPSGEKRSMSSMMSNSRSDCRR